MNPAPTATRRGRRLESTVQDHRLEALDHRRPALPRQAHLRALVLRGLLGFLGAPILAGAAAVPETLYEFNLDSDPGWATEGQWAWGPPQGLGGDPSSGHTGANVYGYNLGGVYPDSIPEFFLTAGPFDCSYHKNVTLIFQRWLGIESATWDHATIQAKAAGGNWTTLWSHTGGTFQDSSWWPVTNNLAAVADRKSDVWIRWGMGPTDSSVTYSGWNLDDIRILGERAAPSPFTWTEPAEGTVLRIDQPHPITVLSHNGRPVVLSVVTGPARIDGQTVTVTNVGTVVLEASQAADAEQPAAALRRTFNRSQVRLTALAPWPGASQTPSATGIHLVGGRAYVANGTAGLAILDLSDPATPVFLGAYDTPGLATEVQVEGNLAYVADGSAGLQILEVSDPTHPVRLGGYDTSGTANAVQVVGSIAYVADGNAGLQILEVGDPASPVRLGSFDTSGSARRVRVVGTVAYVADGTAGLRIVDVGNPANPIGLGAFDTSGDAQSLDVVGCLVFVADLDAGLRILDVADPSTPVGIGIHDTEGQSYDVRVIGNLAYVADGSTGLEVIDVSNPASPLQAGVYDTPGTGYGVKVVGDLAVIADGQQGIQLLRLREGLPQRVSFSPPTSARVDGPPIELTATATSGLPVNFSLISGPASLTGNRLSPTASGAVVVRAEQGGNVQFLPAAIERTIAALRAAQTITWVSPAEGTELAPSHAYPLQATASSGLPVTFSVIHGPAGISGGKLVATNIGRVVVEAHQPGNAIYQPATLQATFGWNDRMRVAVSRAGEWPGYARGEAWAVAVVGETAYVPLGSGGLGIYDVSNPANPARLGGYDTPGFAQGVQVVGGVAYVADSYSGLQILDVSNPASPVRLGGLASGGDARAVHVVGSLAYLASGDSGLQIVDVGNPANPVRVGGHPTSGYALGVHVLDNVAYLADYDSGLQILDVSNPSNPVHLGAYDTSGDAWSVRVVGSLAYVADEVGGLQIVDVGRPSSPVRLGGYDTDGLARGVQLVGTLAYVADGHAGLQILDVSDPASPVRVGGCDTGGDARGVQVVGHLAYVADARGGLQVVDARNQAAPVRRGGHDPGGQARGVRVIGSLAYVVEEGGGLQILDVGNPASPLRLGRYGTGGYGMDLEIVGGTAYVADGYAGLLILDVSDPATPVRLGSYAAGGFARAVQVVGDRAYVADYYSGLKIIGVGDPSNPVLLGGYDTDGTAAGVHVVGSLAYLADSDFGLQILDVTDPAHPARLGGCPTPGQAMGVRIIGNLAYLADSGFGLQILDVTDPASPTRLGGYRTGGYAEGIQVIGNLAYLADVDSGLHILDVTHPTNPFRVGGFDTPGTAYGVRISANLAFVADGEWGLQILHLREEETRNQAPVLTGLSDRHVQSNRILEVGFAVSDQESPAEDLLVGALIEEPDYGTVSVEGTTETRTFRFVPSGLEGVAHVQVTASDGDRTTTSQFLITIGPPYVLTLSSIADTLVPKDGSRTIPFTVAGSETENIAVLADIADPAVIQSVDLAGSGTHWTATLVAAAGVTGTSTITLLATDEFGTGWTTFLATVVPPQVAARHVFYNQSVFDGNNAAANAADDAAIAPDKAALLPGAKASFANYTTYQRGLNGLMIDIAGLPGDPTAADFEFRSGNDSTPAAWPAAPAPATVTVRRGAGLGGSDRVTLVWGADAVKRKWLQVTVLATAATGLAQPDVFYFGNAIGETGNSAADARVAAADALRVLNNLTASAAVANRYDINRDGKVGAADRLTILANLSALDPLTLLDLAAGGAVQGTFPATRPPTMPGLAVVATRAGAEGLRLRWISDGTPVTLWTTDDLGTADWEILEQWPAATPAGARQELVLPVDPTGPARFYRLDTMVDVPTEARSPRQ